MQNRAQVIAMILGTIGVLFMMAMAFRILPTNFAIFAGVACFIVAGAVKRFSTGRSDSVQKGTCRELNESPQIIRDRSCNSRNSWFRPVTPDCFGESPGPRGACYHPSHQLRPLLFESLL